MTCILSPIWSPSLSISEDSAATSTDNQLVHPHHHGEQVLQNGLGDLKDVHAAFCAYLGDLRENSHHILADDGDDRLI